MSGTQGSRGTEEQGRGRTGAPLLPCPSAPLPSVRWGWVPYPAAFLLFFALLRGSIANAWDAGDTVAAAVGGMGLLAWGAARRAALRQRARSRGVRYGSQTLLS